MAGRRPPTALPTDPGALTRSRRFIIPLALLAATSCEESPALRVGEVSFPAGSLLGLSDTQEEQLISLTALGIAAAHDELEVLGEDVLQRGMNDLRIQAVRNRFALDAAGLDEAALREIYRANPEPELVVRHLVVLSERWRSETQRAEARAKAQAALARYRRGEPFPAIAGEVSEEPGAEARGGLLEPGRAGTWVREFWDAAVALAPGQVSGVIETPYGFHVLQLDERRPVAFEEARDRFASRIAEGVLDAVDWEAAVALWMEDESNRMDGPVPEGEALRRAALLAEADRQGVVPDSVSVQALDRDWEALAGGWAGALGFEAGMPDEEIVRVAMDALGRTDQTARILRDEIAPHADAFNRAYSVERPNP